MTTSSRFAICISLELGDHLGPLARVGGALIVAAAVTLTSTGHVDAELALE